MAAIVQTQKYCRRCGRDRLFVKPGVNHLLHLVVTLFMCGLWIPIWILAALSNKSARARCSQCGGK
jgi:hypothetical protein